MNSYLMNMPCAISFSGGRTSGFMLDKILDAHNGVLPDYCKVVFANTGKEMPQTLDFVKECGDRWGVPIVWLECEAKRMPEGNKRKYEYLTHVVDYETADRAGRPFAGLIKARKYLPNPVARFCTQELKVLRIRDYMNLFFTDWVNVVGLRADEQRRVVKMANRGDVILPIAEAGHTVKDVCEFWGRANFDLNLPNNRGKTEWGNCDMCYLKGLTTKISVARERPDLVEWWADQERLNNSRFRNDQPDYKAMLSFTQDQASIFDDASVSCFCTD